MQRPREWRRALGAAALALLLCAGGCNRPASSGALAPAGAPPAVDIPVGPLPGPQTLAYDTPNPFSEDRVALMEGRRLFTRMNCAGCHGDYGGGGMGPSLRDESWIYGGSDVQIFDSIAEGRAHGMPAWGVQLPQEQIWKLTAYIRSMRTPLEPVKPE